MIPNETVQLILEESKVEEVIGDFKELKREGANFKCFSPFSNEKTPSCIVSPSKNIWKDFSSGKGGTALSYLMLAEKMNFPEAIKYLAKKYNIEIVEKKYSAKEKSALAEYHKMYESNNFAKEIFHSTLISSEDKTALEYFNKRGYGIEIIKKFNLGYCDEISNSFTKQAFDSGYPIEILSEVGLSVPKGRNSFDSFKGRVMFPIEDLYGKTIGFGGRILKEKEKQPKYRNSKESRIFNKSKVLFGMSLAKEQVIKRNNVYVCEGYTDVISSHLKGVENIVASCGTSLTKDHLKVLSRFTDTITFFFDGDGAGVKAAFKGIDLALSLGLNPRIVKLPKEHDPDTISKEVVDLEKFLENTSMDFVEYKSSFINKEILSDPSSKAKAIDSILTSIALISDSIERELFTKKLSALINISVASISSSLDNKIYKKSKMLLKDDKSSEDIKASIPEKRILNLIKTQGERKVWFIKTKDKITRSYQSTVFEEIISRLIYLSSELYFSEGFLKEVISCKTSQDDSISDVKISYLIEMNFYEIERNILDEKIKNFEGDDMYMLQDLILRRNKIKNIRYD